MTTLKVRLRQLIRERGMTNKSFVTDFNKAGIDGITITETVISNILKTNREPRTNTVVALAKYFHVTTDYLLGVSDTYTVDKTAEAISGICKGVSEKVTMLERLLREAEAELKDIRILIKIIGGPDETDENDKAYKIKELKKSDGK